MAVRMRPACSLFYYNAEYSPYYARDCSPRLSPSRSCLRSRPLLASSSFPALPAPRPLPPPPRAGQSRARLPLAAAAGGTSPSPQRRDLRPDLSSLPPPLVSRRRGVWARRPDYIEGVCKAFAFTPARSVRGPSAHWVCGTARLDLVNGAGRAAPRAGGALSPRVAPVRCAPGVLLRSAPARSLCSLRLLLSPLERGSAPGPRQLEPGGGTWRPEEGRSEGKTNPRLRMSRSPSATPLGPPFSRDCRVCGEGDRPAGGETLAPSSVNA